MYSPLQGKKGNTVGKYCLKQLEHAFGWRLLFGTCVWDLHHNRAPSGYFAKANDASTIFLHIIEGMTDLYFTNYRLFPCFQIEILRSHCIYHLRRPHLPSSRLLLPRTGNSKRWTIELKEPSPSIANCSDLASHADGVSLDNSSSENFSHLIYPPKRQLSEC